MSRTTRKQLLWIPAKLLVSLVAISVVTFLATNALPGDASRATLGKQASEQQIAEFRAQQRLDDPVIQRYVAWLGDVVQGDLGESVASRQPVWDTIEPRLGRSFVLALVGFALAVPLSLALGLVVGRRAGGLLDAGTAAATLVLAALPEFVIGVALLLVIAVELGALPVDSTSVSLSGVSFSQKVEAFILPALTIALANAPYLIRMTRANTLDVVAEPYMRAAVLRGTRPRSLTFRHMLPNVAPPVVNSTAILLGSLIGGVVAIEVVFAFPGIGQLLVSAVQIQDVAVVQALALIIGAAYVTINALADLTVVLLTPRLRTESA